MILLKQSTVTTVQLGPFLDETTGKDAETGLTIAQADVRVSKGGAAFAQKTDANAAAHDELGWYRCQLDATDTATLGRLIVAVHESGALPVWREFMVVPANVYDSLVAGSDVLTADVTQIGGLAISGNNATLNLKQLNISNDAGSAILAVSTGSDGHGMELAGHGGGSGLKAAGGDGADGMYSLGGGSGGHGFRAQGAGGNKHGFYGMGIGSGAGACFVGGTTGPGLDGTGGVASGDGAYFHAEAGNGNGLRAVKHGTGADIHGDIPGTVATVTTLTGHTVQTGDSFARIGAPVGASISVDIAAIAGDASAANQTTIITHLTDIKGTGFAKDTDSAVDLAHTGADSDTLETLSDQIDAVSGGVGAIPVDHDTGGAENLAYKTGGGVGIDNATVEAYLKSDYDAGNYGSVYLKAVATTDVNGRWAAPMMLDAETYTLRYYKQNEYGPEVKEVTVS